MIGKIDDRRLDDTAIKICILFFKFIYFNWKIITLWYWDGFVINHHKWITGAHVFPHPELPSHPIPLGCPRAPTLRALLHASNLHWSSILHMIIYMFQCYSLKSPHFCLLLYSLKVCSLLLCLFFYLAYKSIVTVFLNSIYMC